jgi:hypothetical protein
MKFSTITLAEFHEVRPFRRSDTPGNGWHEYGKGVLRLNIITGSDGDIVDLTGRGQLTFHNDLTIHNYLTKACGINTLSPPVIKLSTKCSQRVTFKAWSNTFGNQWKKNKYTVKLQSSKDAKRLFYLCELLQKAAPQAKVSHDITPNAAKMLLNFAIENEALKSRLLQLAEPNPITIAAKMPFNFALENAKIESRRLFYLCEHMQKAALQVEVGHPITQDIDAIAAQMLFNFASENEALKSRLLQLAEPNPITIKYAESVADSHPLEDRADDKLLCNEQPTRAVKAVENAEFWWRLSIRMMITVTLTTTLKTGKQPSPIGAT